MTRPAEQRLSIVLAGAGTGKTYRLCEEYARAVNGGGPEAGAAVDPARVLVTTFTVKAAAELVERCRAKLLNEGAVAIADRLSFGRIGTVNSIGGRLLSEFAIDLGISPVCDVLAEDQAKAAFRIAGEAAIDAWRDVIEPVAWRLGLDEKSRPDGATETWADLVGRIVALARQNGIAPDAFANFAVRSRHGLLDLLPAPTASADTLDAALGAAITAARSALAGSSDTAVATNGARRMLDDAQHTFDTCNALPWSVWAKLSRVKCAKTSDTMVAPVREAAAVHPAHPRLHADLSAMIDGVFAAAAGAAEQYQGYKRAFGLVDFADQERMVLDAFERADIREKLSERLSLVLVDEFQDTSPLQLALFLRLGTIAGRALWVGDPKQAIYGFRGTDPDLVRAVAERVVAKENVDRLTTSYRSRPGLVSFTNDVFGAAFPPIGVPERDVHITVTNRADLPGQAPPLHLWWLPKKNWEQALAALASSVADMLAGAEAWPVPDGEESLRPLRGADIAVLCRSRGRMNALAAALGRAGVKVAIGRKGLLDCPEVVLGSAALRYLVDQRDTLAMAEIVHITLGEGGAPGWLERWLMGGVETMRTEFVVIAALDAARAQLGLATPGEALDLALVTARVPEIVAGWDRTADRLANVDALRGLARTYEDGCRASRGAATAAGLVGWLRSQRLDDDIPASADPGAVHVLTYHGAKGLEWPVVILADLGDPPPPSPFGLSVEARADCFDPWQPLDGRWLRYWPWPYGLLQKDVYLDIAASSTPEMRHAIERQHAEQVRLLYVGVTRARDYLVLAPRIGKAQWIDELVAADGTPTCVLSTVDGEQTIVCGGREHRTFVRFLSAPDDVEPNSEAPPADTICVSPRMAAELAPRTSYVVRPSEADGEPVSAIITEEVALGPRIPFTGSPDMERLGEAVHRFLAADRGADEKGRVTLARSILARWGVSEVTPADLLEASDRLRAFVGSRWPEARWRREWPVCGRLGEQRARGRVDLLLEMPHGIVIIDHKSFPGRPELWNDHALGYAPQLFLYAALVRAAGREIAEAWIHLPVVGRALRLFGFAKPGNPPLPMIQARARSGDKAQ